MTRTQLALEQLEDRTVPSTVTVNAGQVVRTVNAHVLGVNLTWWDSALTTLQTQQMVQAAGLNFFRFPGGSSSDTWHFNAAPTYNGEGTSPSMASVIAALGGAGLVTLNYGTASPQESAALLAYLNAPTNNTTAIGMGPEWSDASNSWVNVDWKTAGYWAGLRAAAPLAQNDGLNFLRLGRSAPFGIHYFEVGNEVYGSWETDHHAAAHDPATYVTFARQLAAYAALIDSTISIGVDTGSVSGDNNWTANVLQQCAAQGFTPGFLSDHSYMQGPGSESDATLLLHTVSDSASGLDWAVRASGYRSLLVQKLGAAAASHVELLATEFNSVWSNPGKQSTSLVNGLFVADSLGSLLQTEYNGADVWDLRNSWETGNNNSSGLYGWRQGGDYGLLGDGSGTAPSTGTYVPYPSYFAEQLLSKMVHTGDTVVQATSDDATLAAYAVRQQNGHLDLLVINKNAGTDVTGQFNVNGFTPGSGATVWQYGKAQDTAQSQTSDGHASLANSTPTLALDAGGFSFKAPAYSMTVLDLAPDHLAFGAQPSNVLTGAAVAPAVTVRVLDQFNNLESGDNSDTITLTVASGPGGFAAGSTTTATVSGGVATFSNLVFNTRGTYTLSESTTGGLSGPNSNSFVVSWPPIALVGSPQVNGNDAALAGAQRSLVSSLVYTFNHAVSLAAGAFSIALRQNVTVNGKTGQTVGTLPTLGYSTSDGGVTWVVTFSGSGVVNGSIADGVYDLTLNAAMVTDAQGQSLSANRVDTFYRLFGDADGNRKVNNADLAAFSAAFNKRTGQSGYLAYLDYDGSGRVDNGDLAQFANRFNTAFGGF